MARVPKNTTPTQAVGAIYARVSTTEQADKGYSLPTQIDACQTMAHRHGYTVPDTHVFVDDYTGTSLGRPQLTQLRDLIRQRLVQAVFVHDLDRLSRKLAHQLLLSEEFEQASVALHVVTMPEGDKTPETQLLSNVRGIIAEYERAKILERTARGRRGRAQAGHIPGGRPPFGYIAAGDHYVICAEEAALVQRIFALYLSGMSLEAIARVLTREDIAPPGARRPGIRRRLGVSVWHPSSVQVIIHNAAYVGTQFYGKVQRIPGARNPDKKTRWRAVEKAAWIPIAVPPILDEATFQAAQSRAQRNRVLATRNRQHDYLFVSGRLRCGQCGHAMSGHSYPNGAARYRCTRRRGLDMLSPHTRRGVVARDVEPEAWAAVERVLHNPALITAELERQREGTSSSKAQVDYERQQYERQLAQGEKDLKRWEAAYLGEAIDLDDFKAKKAEVDARRASAERELARLDDQQCLLEQAELEAVSLRQYCERVRQEMQHFTLEEKRKALEYLDITVTWHPEWPTLQIEGSLPPELFAIATNTSC